MRLRRLAFWSAVLLFVEVTAGELVGWARFVLASDLRGPDFYSYYAMSLLLLRRGPQEAYDLAVQKQFQDQVTSQWPGHFILLPHILPPWVTLVLYPLGLVPFRAAYVGWGVAIIALVAAGIAILLRAGDLHGRRAILAAAAAAASLPVFVLLLQGQSDGLMIPALAASALHWIRGNPGRAGAFAALAMVKPQLVLLLPALFLVRRSGRAVAAFAAVAALLAAVSLVAFGLPGCLRWLSVLAPWAFAGTSEFPVDTQSQYSLRGLLQLLALPTVIQLAVLGAGMLALVLILARSRANPRLQVAAAVAGSIALSPYQHAHDLSLLIVPGLLLAGALPGLARPRLGAALLAGAWLGVELLIMAPVTAAIAIVGLAGYLAWECLGEGAAKPIAPISHRTC